MLVLCLTWMLFPPYMIEELLLQGKAFAGTIPSEIGRLAALEQLALNRASYIGQIPSELGQLENLEYLLLDSNKLSGTLPCQLGNLADGLGKFPPIGFHT